MFYDQFDLIADDGSVMVVWLAQDARLRVGKRITLKGMPGRVWEIAEHYHMYRMIDESYFHRHWNVGGLCQEQC